MTSAVSAASRWALPACASRVRLRARRFASSAPRPVAEAASRVSVSASPRRDEVFHRADVVDLGNLDELRRGLVDLVDVRQHHADCIRAERRIGAQI
jgi:hypothetical protein